MRYEDTSGSVSNSGTPEARDDADALPTGSNGPATGNVITGAGTLTGKAGEDVAANGHVVAIRGAGGTDTSDNGQSLHVDGRYGALVIDEHGNYKYVADGHAPEDFRDLFQYTLADAKGGRSVADLVISRGAELKVAENAQRIVPGPDGVVTLPAGVDLNDVHVLGRDLVVTLPDGSQIVIVDGAVFVPQLVLGGVEVPSTNLASLLVESELNTTAGTPQSSGGNFDVPVPPLDPGVPLGDLIPPTELVFTPPEFRDIGQFIDKHPDAGTAAVQLDDDAKAGGNPGGVGDDPDSVGTPGVLPGSGGDGALTWDLLSSGAPAGFSYVDGPNGSILVQQVQGGNTVTVLTITINGDTGAYTVTQNAAILHPTGDNENNVAFVINYTVTDSDGDSALGTLNVNVDDDTPTVTVIAGSDANVSLTTHDAATIGANSEAVSTTANFSGVFSGTVVSPGADGAGAGSVSGYALSTTGGASGLTQGGVAINLYSVSGAIVGSTSATSGGITAANTVFTVSTTNTGIVTLTQFSQIDHTNTDPSPTGAPFTDHIISLTDGSITLTRSETVVDKDGDSVTGSASVGIGANLHFVDDGPTIGLAEHGEPSLIVDETDLGTNATASFAANFSANFGADGPAAAGSITYALGINAGATGLIDVATGSPIVLVQNGAVVEGHVGDASGALAFTVSVNAAGDVTLDQIRALQHPDGTNPDDSVTFANDNLVTLTATAHDFDGDTASSTLNIGQNLNFEDDGPSISASQTQPSLTVDETDLSTNATASFAGVFTSSFGADGAGTVTYALGINAGATGLVDVATGQAIVLVNNAGVIEGHVGNAAGALAFQVSIDASGNVTLDQTRALQHPDFNNPDDSVTLASDNLVTITATVTDKDGDSATATANIGQNLNFEDDGPSISANGNQEPNLTVDETDLTTNATANFAANFTSSFGADGAGLIGYSLVVSAPGANSGLIDVATGLAIVLVQNGTAVEGHVGTAVGALAFTVSVNGAGDVTLDQVRAVQHPDTTNPDDSVTLASDNLIALRAIIVDKDGDSTQASINIGQNLNFKDDGPSISASSEQPSLTVDETILATNATASFAGVFTSSFGADGAGTVTYALGISASGANSGLVDTLTGSAIVLVQNGAVVEGHVGNAVGALAFTVSVDASGNVTLDQIRAVVHPDVNNPNDSVTLGADNLVTLTATVTDKDGDHQSATANIGTNLVFQDDGPSINATGAQPTLTVDETVLATNATASFAGVFNSAFGADGAGTVTYALGISAPGANSGLVDTLTGQAIVLVQNGLVVEGHVGNAAGALAFTVTVDASGNVTLDQIRAVVHNISSNPDTSEGVTLSADNLVTLTATVTDKDGDHQSATANIGQNLVFNDDGPSAINDSDTIASGGNSATGNVITGIGTDGGVATADNAGADQPGHITAIQGAGGTDTTFFGGVLSIGGTWGTLNIDADGNYTYTRNAGAPGSVDDVFTYTLSDADGDTTTATLTIHINDAAPPQPNPVAVWLDDDALAGGNAGTPAVGDRTPDTQNTIGTLTGGAGDGDTDFFLSASQTLPTGFTSNLTALAGVQTLAISQNGTLVITVTLTNETGDYTVVQNAPVMHALDGNTEGEIPLGNILSAINVSFYSQDADGDQSPTQNITITVDDDTPTVTASSTQPILTVDETVLATNASASFASVFTDSFGADGPAAANSVTYALGINAGSTGLVDTLTNEAVVLVNNAGTIEGRTAVTNALVFTVSVNAGGSVTLDQIRAIVHADPNDPNDSKSLSADNLVTLTQTITDKDGDQASATANIGQNLVFQDDGPSISTTGVEPTLTVDETVLATNANASFAANFNSSFGADGAGTVTYALGVNAGSTGLVDTLTNEAVVLVNNAGTIEGRTAVTNALVFTVSVNASGNVTLDQIRAVVHPNTSDPNDSKTLSADNLVTLTATVTDKDGDHQSATLNIGQNLVFLDDGPSISTTGVEPTLTVDETVLATNANASFAANFNSSFGADGAGAVTYALGINAGSTGLVDTLTNEAVVLVNNAGVIEGRTAVTNALVFTVSVNASGSVTLDQIRAIVHANPNDPNDSKSLSADNLVVLTATVTDKDGDHQSAALNIGQNLVFLDDGPSISTTGVEPTLTVDETVLATNANASFAANFNSSFGADGAGTVTYALGVNAGSTGLTDTATGEAVVLVNNAGVIEGRTAVTNALVFTVSVNGSGSVTLDQIRAVVHPNASDPNDSKTLSADNLVTLTATVTDKDGDHQSATLNIGQNLIFQDDGPSAAIGTTGQGVSVDESAGIQADSNDTTSAGVIALFAGVTNKGVDTDLPQYATNASAVVNSTGTVLGADGGTVAFSLSVSSAGVDSGLNTTDGQDIFLFKEGNLIVGRVGNASGPAAFALAIDNTGHVSMVEYLSINHSNAANPDDSVSITNGAVLAVVTATDGDNDTSSASTAIGGLISFQDSGPIMTAADNINIQNSGTVDATGGFHYLLGADGALASNDVLAVTGSATVNGTSVTNYVINETSENAATAVYTFSFDYPNGTGTTAHETGTLTFDKAAGTYTVDLADPISGFSILATAGAPASAFVNYNLGTSTTSSGPSEVAVVQLDTNFFLQFSGVYDKTGSDHQSTTAGAAGSYSPTTGTFAGLDLFTQANATVTLSSSAAGVAGNTIQGGEVLDFNLYTTDHQGFIGATPDTSATSMFIELDGVGSSEDMIIILKLYDTVTHQYTEQALMVQNGDIIKSNATLAGTAYSGIVLDSNDGLIVIEANDYQAGNTNLVIVGAQIAGSDDGITGNALNFNGALGALGGSSGTQTFATDVSDAPFKIQNIGFALTTTTSQNADLTFNVTVRDGDNDTISQTIHATVTSAADSATPISLSSGVTTVAAAPLDTKSLISTTSDSQKTTTTDSNNILLSAVAAAGLTASQSLAAESNHANGSANGMHGLDTAMLHTSALSPVALEAVGGNHVANVLMPAVSGGAAHANAQAALHASDAAQGRGLSAAGSDAHSQAQSELLQGTQAPAHGPAVSQTSATAASIVMPAAHQLVAAATGGAHHGQGVGQVLADALHGGAGGATIDSALASLPGHGGANAALAALASHAGAAVPNGDSSDFAGFTPANAHFTMEHMIAHVDAAPSHG